MCLSLGVEHPDRLTIDARQVDDWLQYYAAEPWGFHIDEIRLAKLSATIGNFSGNAKRLLSPQDFLPKEKPDSSFVDRMKSHFKSMSNGQHSR